MILVCTDVNENAVSQARVNNNTRNLVVQNLTTITSNLVNIVTVGEVFKLSFWYLSNLKG